VFCRGVVCYYTFEQPALVFAALAAADFSPAFMVIEKYWR
jgi:hypothetical protein